VKGIHIARSDFIGHYSISSFPVIFPPMQASVSYAGDAQFAGIWQTFLLVSDMKGAT
jgi:hypothetical protein